MYAIADNKILIVILVLSEVKNGNKKLPSTYCVAILVLIVNRKIYGQLSYLVDISYIPADLDVPYLLNVLPIKHPFNENQGIARILVYY